MSDDIDAAILQLAAAKRLSAVSCMVALERCGRQALQPLLELQDRVDIGLHLCFADETLRSLENMIPPLPAFGTLVRKSCCGNLAREARRQVEVQYDLFVKKTGRTPDFIDGHLHSHQLPGIRTGLIQFVLGLPAGTRPYVRNTRQPLRVLRKHRLPWLKAALVGSFGVRMAADLHAAGIATNEGFVGIYDFRQWRQYAGYFPRFAACLQDPNGMIVVHPGERQDWRRSEFTTLNTFPFPAGKPNRFTPGPRNIPSAPDSALQSA